MNLSLTEREKINFGLLFGLTAVIMGLALGVVVAGTDSSLQLVVVVVGLIVLLATVTDMQWGLLVLVFISFTRFSDIAIAYHGAPSIAKSFIALLVVGILARWFVSGVRPEGWERSAFIIAAFGIVGFASLLYAEDFSRASDALNDFVKDLTIVLIIGVLMQNLKVMRRVLWTLLIAGMFLGTLSVYQYMTGTYGDNYWGFAQAPELNIVGDTDGNRASGPIGDPNFFAQIMLVLVPIALDRFIHEKKRWIKVLAGYALAISILTIVVTFSRGAFVAMVMMLGLMFLYRPPKPAALVGLVLFGLLLLPFVPSSYTNRIMTLVDFLPGIGNPTAEVSFRGRTSEVIVAWLMFVDNPILGVGVDHYPLNYQQYSRQLGLDPRTEERAAHNLYLEVASERGLLGLAAFGIIMLELFRGLYYSWNTFRDKEMHDEAAMIAAYTFGLIGYLFAAMFIHDAYPRYLWMFIGIGLSIPVVTRNEILNPSR